MAIRGEGNGIEGILKYQYKQCTIVIWRCVERRGEQEERDDFLSHNLKVAGSNPAPATKIMALSQRLSAISMSGTVLQENTTRNRAIPNSYGR